MADTKLNYTLSLKDLFSGKMDQAFNSTKKLDGGMNKLNNTMGAMKNLFLGTVIGGSMVSFGKSVVESLKNYEFFTAAIKTMLHGDQQAAAALQGQLTNLAKTTPFNLVDVQDASKQLLAYGFQAGELVDQMRLLGDVSAGIGAPIGDIAYLYGTLKTSGRVTLMDLRQFAGRGIPIYETLAKRLNTTTAAINTMVHDGKLGFKDIEGAFQDMTKEGGQFFNLMDDQSKTVGGRLSNLGDVWDQLKVNIGKSQTGIINSTISWVADMVGAMNDAAAAANRMELAFNKGKVDQFSTSQRILNSISTGMGFGPKKMVMGEDAFQVYQNDKFIQENFVDKATKSPLEAAKAKADILQFMTSLSKDFINKNINKDVYEKTYALAQLGLESIGGQQKLFQMKPGGALDSNKTVTKTETTNGTEVNGARPQNLTINITKLIEKQEINTTNLTESTAKIKEEVTKALLETVNDINNMAR